MLPKNRYGNQHILPLAQMSVSDTCHFLPSIDYGPAADMQLGMHVCLCVEIST